MSVLSAHGVRHIAVVVMQHVIDLDGRRLAGNRDFVSVRIAPDGAVIVIVEFRYAGLAPVSARGGAGKKRKQT